MFLKGDMSKSTIQAVQGNTVPSERRSVTKSRVLPMGPARKHILKPGVCSLEAGSLGSSVEEPLLAVCPFRHPS